MHSIGATLMEKLDSISTALQDHEHSHAMRNENMMKNMRSQQLALEKIHGRLEIFAAKTVDMLVLLSRKWRKRNITKNPA